MSETRLQSIIKPNLKTQVHIDFDWWQQHDRDWRVLLQGYLSPDQKGSFENIGEDQTFDIIDPNTAEVKQVDALQYLLVSQYSSGQSYISPTTPLVEAIFRLFLACGNQPMTPEEIGEKLDRPIQTVLQILSGKRVYQGIRPYID